jgi:predicted AAA+ superfamily ATPase
VFEAWVFSELLKNYYNRGATTDLYFWRDSTGHEVDLLLDQGEELVPIEAKSGQTFAADYLQGLTYWRSLAGQKHKRAALVYGGDSSYMREGIAVLSWRHWE